MNKNVIILISMILVSDHQSHGLPLNQIVTAFFTGSISFPHQLMMQRDDHLSDSFENSLRHAHLYSQQKKFCSAKTLLEGILKSPASFEKEGLWARLPAIRSLIDDEIKSDLIMNALEETLIFTKDLHCQYSTYAFDIAEVFLDIGHKKRAREIFIDLLQIQEKGNSQNIWIKLSTIKELLELKEPKDILNFYLEKIMIQDELDPNEQMLAAELFVDLNNVKKAQQIVESLLKNQDKVNLDWIYFQSPIIKKLIKESENSQYLINLVKKVLENNLEHWTTDEDDRKAITDILNNLIP